MPKGTSSSRRNYDRESGKDRVKPNRSGKERRSRRAPSPVPESSSDEQTSNDSDSSVEEALQMRRKDDSRRAPPPQKERKTKRSPPKKDVVSNAQDDTVPALDGDSTSSDHTTLGIASMLAFSLHFEMLAITRPVNSYYVPDLRNLFVVLNFAQGLVCDNTHLHYIEPSYFSLATTLYYSYMVIYHILRTRDISGTLDRNTKRALARFVNALKPESATIMGPLVGFFTALGGIRTNDPMYKWILPNIPEYAGSATYTGGTFMYQTDGSGRLPSIPCIMAAINTAINATINADTFTPFTPAAHDATTGTHWFGIEIRKTSATNPALKRDFAALAGSAGWLSPPDYFSSLNRPFGSVKKNLQRKNFPETPDTYVVDTLLKYLCFSDNDDLSWLTSLAKIAANEAKFFKGSVTLASIEPVTTIGSYVGILRSVPTKADGTAGDQIGYPSTVYPRFTNYHLSGTHRFGGTSREEMKIGISAGYFAKYATTANPTDVKLERLDSGPIFDTAANPPSIPIAQFELSEAVENLQRYEQVIDAMMFDPKGEQ